jgi:Uma2 family endonuclease
MADVSTHPDIPMISPTAVRWTRDDCDVFERAGVLKYRYELVDGVINRLGQNIGHANMIRLLIDWLYFAFGSKFFLTQASIDVRPEDNPTSKPEPDGIVLSRPAEELTANPTPADIRLLIEAADTTTAYDLTTKASLYARAGIVEYWVVSLPDRQLYVHRQPHTGAYQDVTAYAETASVAPLAAPDQFVQVAKLLPTPQLGD